MQSIASFQFVDWITIAGAAWLIYQGAAAVWRRDLHLFGHAAGRSFQRSVRGPWAVIGGLAWVAVGLGLLYSRFWRVV